MPPAANISEIFVSVQGEGVYVGRQHLFVRFGGCPLRCRYCDTPSSLVPAERCRVFGADQADELHPNPITVEALDRVVARRAATEPGLHALVLTGGEPLAQAGFLASWLESRTGRLPVLLETAATLPLQLERLVGRIDILSADIKLPSNSGEPARWAEHEACLRLSVGSDVYVKLPVDETTDADEVEKAMRLVASVDAGIPVILQPIAGRHARLDITPRTLERFYRRAVGLGVDVRVLPQVHKVLGVR